MSHLSYEQIYTIEVLLNQVVLKNEIAKTIYVDKTVVFGDLKLAELLMYGKYNEKIQNFIVSPSSELHFEIIELVNFIFQSKISQQIDFINFRISKLSEEDSQKMKSISEVVKSNLLFELKTIEPELNDAHSEFSKSYKLIEEMNFIQYTNQYFI